MADNDFSFLDNLSAADAELAPITRSGGDSNGRQRAVQNNPFVAWLQDSKEKEIGKAVTVPARQAKQTEYLIRQAAADLALGVRVVRIVDGEAIKDKKALDALHPNKKVTMQFQAQKKRKYAPRPSRSVSTTVAETPAPVATQE
jgi:hypothetical protein